MDTVESRRNGPQPSTGHDDDDDDMALLTPTHKNERNDITYVLVHITNFYVEVFLFLLNFDQSNCHIALSNVAVLFLYQRMPVISNEKEKNILNELYRYTWSIFSCSSDGCSCSVILYYPDST